MDAEAPSELLSRRHQMFPLLGDADIARMQRFATRLAAESGTRLFTAGESAPGMYVVLAGAVEVSQRDGLGTVTPIVRGGRGHFIGEVGALSGQSSLVDALVLERAELLLLVPGALRALIIAEADLGERLVRALILRRLALIEAGASGPVLIGRPGSADLLRLQNFLRRNGEPHHVVDAGSDTCAAALMEQYGAAASEPLAVCPDGTVLRNPGEAELARCLGMVDTQVHDELFDVAVVGAGPAGCRPRCMRPPKGCAWWCSTAAPTAARPGPARVSRTTWAFPPASPARRWPGAPTCRRRSSARTS